MKNKIFILATLLLFSISFAACGTTGADEPDEAGDITIAGQWGYMYTIEGPDGFPFAPERFHAEPPAFEIGAGGRASVTLVETFIEGTLVKTGEHTYVFTSQRAAAEGESWEPEDAFLAYDPASGVLRYTFFDEQAGMDIHHHFVRGDSPLLG